MGIIAATPRPTNKNPTVAITGTGKITDNIKPLKIKIPLNLRIRTLPNLLFILSDINLPVAIAPINDT